jgi:hypothetical protein
MVYGRQSAGMDQSSIHQPLKKGAHVMPDRIAMLRPIAINEMRDDFSDLVGTCTIPHDRFGGITQFQSTLRIEEQASAGPSVRANDRLGIECGPGR